MGENQVSRILYYQECFCYRESGRKLSIKNVCFTGNVGENQVLRMFVSQGMWKKSTKYYQCLFHRESRRKPSIKNICFTGNPGRKLSIEI